MYFESLQAAFYMDGHGAFVWAAYLITAVAVVWLLLAPHRRARRFLTQLSDDMRRQEAATRHSAEDS
jgi:heme exporter protein D